jgi:hypothetical protein
MEELEPERAPVAEKRLVRLEADVAPGVVVELGDRRRQGRDAGLVGDLGEVLRPALHVGEAEGSLRPPFTALRPRLHGRREESRGRESLDDSAPVGF